MAGVVGIALTGGSQSESPTAVVAQSPEPPAASVTIPRPTVDPGRDRALLVRGWVAETRRDLRVMVTTGRGGRIDIAQIDPTGMPRNGMVPFEATFRIPRALADLGGGMFVVPVGAAGNDLGVDRVPVEGAVVELVVR